jgi:hypothetical protein
MRPIWNGASLRGERLSRSHELGALWSKRVKPNSCYCKLGRSYLLSPFIHFPHQCYAILSHPSSQPGWTFLYSVCWLHTEPNTEFARRAVYYEPHESMRSLVGMRWLLSRSPTPLFYWFDDLIDATRNKGACRAWPGFLQRESDVADTPLRRRRQHRIP